MKLKVTSSVSNSSVSNGSVSNSCFGPLDYLAPISLVPPRHPPTMLSQRRPTTRPVTTAPAPAASYSFPELRLPEILQCLEDLRIPSGEAELAKPTAASVIRLYEGFSDIFLGGSVGAVGANAVGGLSEILEFPEIHQDSINLVSFYRSM